MLKKKKRYVLSFPQALILFLIFLSHPTTILYFFLTNKNQKFRVAILPL